MSNEGWKLNKLVRYLNYHIQGCVYDKPSVLAAYSKDQSILKIKPRLVAVPDTTEDIQFLVRFSNELAKKGYELPIAVRGAGLDRTGADLTKGLVISTEKLDKIKEIDDHARLVRVEAGCTLAKLNSVLSVYGLTLPIKANGRETIGGLISGFRTDEYSKKYGGIYRYVDRMEVVLSSGDIIQTTPLTDRGLAAAKKKTDYEGKVYRDLDQLLEKNFDVVEDLARSANDFSGFRMVSHVKDNRNFSLTPIFHGAQGALGIITEVILQVESLPRPSKRILSHFASIEAVADYAAKVQPLGPLSVELIDSRIVRIAASAGKTFDIINQPAAGSYYVITVFNDNPIKIRRNLRDALALASHAKQNTVEDDSNKKDFDNLEDIFDIYLNDEATRPIITGDTRVPLERLADFVHRIDLMEQRFERKMPIFGSLSTNILEVRPSFDFSDVLGRRDAIMFLKDYSNLIDEMGGSLAGGGAEGRTKAAVTTARIPTRERDLYVRIKQIFDPNLILAPDIKLGASVQDLVKHLRTDEIAGFMV